MELKKIKEKNKIFTSGEDSILEQAAQILVRRKTMFYSEVFLNKKLIIIEIKGGFCDERKN